MTRIWSICRMILLGGVSILLMSLVVSLAFWVLSFVPGLHTLFRFGGLMVVLLGALWAAYEVGCMIYSAVTDDQ